MQQHIAGRCVSAALGQSQPQPTNHKQQQLQAKFCESLWKVLLQACPAASTQPGSIAAPIWTWSHICLAVLLNMQALAYSSTFLLGIYAIGNEPWFGDTSYFWDQWPEQHYS